MFVIYGVTWDNIELFLADINFGTVKLPVSKLSSFTNILNFDYNKYNNGYSIEECIPNYEHITKYDNTGFTFETNVTYLGVDGKPTFSDDKTEVMISGHDFIVVPDGTFDKAKKESSYIYLWDAYSDEPTEDMIENAINELEPIFTEIYKLYARNIAMGIDFDDANLVTLFKNEKFNNMINAWRDKYLNIMQKTNYIGYGVSLENKKGHFLKMNVTDSVACIYDVDCAIIFSSLPDLLYRKPVNNAMVSATYAIILDTTSNFVSPMTKGVGDSSELPSVVKDAKVFFKCAYAHVCDGNTEIDLGSFYNNNQLRAIRLPDNLERIDAYAFTNCNNISRITLPDTVRELGKHAFANCFLLGKINIPEGVEEIPSHCFYNTAFTEYVVLPKSVKTLRFYAFCTSVNDYFESCNRPDSEKTKVLDLSNVTCIEDGAFSKNWGIEEVILSPDCKKIESYAFEGCKNLKKINLENVQYIGTNAFSDCKSLEYINLNTAYQLKDNVFAGCISLKVVDNYHLDIIPYGTFKSIRCLESFDFSHIKWISGAAFWCAGIKDEIDLTNIERIDACAFYGSNLNFKDNCVDIPNCTSVGKEAFFDVKNINLAILHKSFATQDETIRGREFFDPNVKILCVGGK